MKEIENSNINNNWRNPECQKLQRKGDNMQYPLNSKVYNPEYQSQKQKNLKNISFRLNHQTKFITAHKIQNPRIDKHRKNDIFYDFHIRFNDLRRLKTTHV